MSICKLTVTTTVDGRKTQTVRMGKMERTGEGATLSYREENARVALTLDGKAALVVREGDYALRLPLRQGETQEGVLGVGGSEGKILVRAYRVEYAIEEKGVLAKLHYALLFGEDAQDMRLEIRAQGR